MTRQIKFRVWDGNKMHYLESFKDKANHLLQFGSNGFWVYSFETGNLIASSENGCKIMQFTGLYDKNRKEIYEGDIVEKSGYNRDEGEWTKRFEVGFYHDGFSLKRLDCWYAFGNSKGSILIKEYVIGNVHDNPELLK